MTFSAQQTAALRAKLRRRHVKTRLNNGMSLHFLEGWHVIAEANRIFGFDCWDRRTQSPRCVWSHLGKEGQTAVIYTTTVRITVRAGGAVVMREGIGTGFGRATAPEVAHDIALKAAETDATKRALATFGNPFGLPLYDKQQKSVTKPNRTHVAHRPRHAPGARDELSAPSFTLHIPDGQKQSFGHERDWLAAAHAAVPQIETLTALYAFWNLNKCVFKQVRLSPIVTGAMVESLIEALKARARALGRSIPPPPAPKSDSKAGVLLIPKEKRIRSKAHLAFVRTLPCIVCGRQPSHAHHIKFAQQGALGMKVSDEFTVPLCFLHHDALHQAGNERAWWEACKIDPLPIAADLWASTRGAHDNTEPTSPSLSLQHEPSSATSSGGVAPDRLPLEAPQSHGSAS
jgi:Rad52/22 family double-strand break repair protein/Protein of unknown function (DUF968)